MTLHSLLLRITETAIERKIINYAAATSDIYQVLNGMTIKDYPVLFVSPTGNHTVNENTTTFEVTLYFFDRLLQDHSNDVDVQSVAIEQLKNMVNWIKSLDGVVNVSDEYTVRNFIETEALSDECAGAWATIRIETLNAYTCPQD